MYWLLLLAPVVFIVPHTLVGLLLIPLYGAESIRWSEGAIEVVAKKRADGTSRIIGDPGAQTWGLLIFYRADRFVRVPGLRVHERVHILQSALFGVVYPVTYVLSFLVLLAGVRWFGWWSNKPASADWVRAYLRIPWEIWAFHKQVRFNSGEIEDAWGSKGSK